MDDLWFMVYGRYMVDISRIGFLKPRRITSVDESGIAHTTNELQGIRQQLKTARHGSLVNKTR